jgi:NAD(P)-dependent dehydrogenase (short-subunit alcohol dehydrogenase family)
VPDFDLSNRTAIVTGASQGLGKGVALELARAGADVAVVARLPEPVTARGQSRPHEPVGPVVAEIEAMGRRALGITADVREANQVASMVQQTLDAFGRVDILVNNAGGSWGEGFNVGELLDITEEDLDETFRLNVMSMFLCCRAVAPVMKRQGKGAIVNVASVAGRTPARGRGSYGLSKAAVINLTQTMAQEWGPEVRVNVLVPGSIYSPHRPTSSGASAEPDRQPNIALGRMGLAEEFAGAVLFLASDAGGYTTGAALDVHGGRHG